MSNELAEANTRIEQLENENNKLKHQLNLLIKQMESIHSNLEPVVQTTSNYEYLEWYLERGVAFLSASIKDAKTALAKLNIAD